MKKPQLQTNDLRYAFDQAWMADERSEGGQQLGGIAAELRKPHAIACEAALRSFEIGEQLGRLGFTGQVVREIEALFLIRSGNGGWHNGVVHGWPPSGWLCGIDNKMPPYPL